MEMAIQKYMSMPTMISSETIPLEKVHNLPSVLICARDQLNWTALNQLGYGKYMLSFYKGTTEYDKNVLTWGGNRSFTYQQSLNFLYPDNPWNRSMVYYHATAEVLMVAYGRCIRVDHYHFNWDDVFPLTIAMTGTGLIGNGSIQVWITDPARSLNYRPFEGSMSGDMIYQTVARADNPIKEYKRYHIEVEEMHWQEDKQGCTVYGQDGSAHASFAACVEQEDREEFMPVLGCMLPWMSASDHCTGILKKKSGFEALIKSANIRLRKAVGFMEYLSDSCLPPCIQTSVRSKYLGSNKNSAKNQIHIYFSPTVKKSSEEVAYGPTDLLVEIGSSLGLWLGLSSVSLFDIFVTLLEYMKRNI